MQTQFSHCLFPPAADFPDDVELACGADGSLPGESRRRVADYTYAALSGKFPTRADILSIHQSPVKRP